MAGGARAPGFDCGAPPEWFIGSVPAYLDGHLCGEEVAYSHFDVVEEGVHTIFFERGTDFVFLDMVTPEGVEVALLGPDRSSITLELTPGLHVLSALPVDLESHGGDWFAVQVVSGEGY